MFVHPVHVFGLFYSMLQHLLWYFMICLMSLWCCVICPVSLFLEMLKILMYFFYFLCVFWDWIKVLKNLNLVSFIIVTSCEVWFCHASSDEDNSSRCVECESVLPTVWWRLYPRSWVRKFSKNIGATSNFYVPEGWPEANYIMMTWDSTVVC
jgi:hypothetical protein